MDRYHLRYFLAVIDEGNFSKAAAACNVSQPTLSVGIAKLEQSLGRQLFNRTNKRVELTAAGARLSAHARRIEAEFALAEREVSGTQPAALLRIGMLSSIPFEWTEAFLFRLGAEGPLHWIEIVEGRERELAERLTRGRIDVALTILRSGTERFESEQLFSEGYSLALPANHPLGHRDMIEADELADNPMIVRRHCELLSDTSRFFTARGVRPAFLARTVNDDKALRYVRAGLGITVMPDCFGLEGVARPRLAGFLFEREIGLLYAEHADAKRLRGEPPLRALVESIQAARGAEQ